LADVQVTALVAETGAAMIGLAQGRNGDDLIDVQRSMST